MALKLTREYVDAAKNLLNHPIITDIFNDMEKEAIDKAIALSPVEHELRFALLQEAKVIRTLRSRLLNLKAREANLGDEGEPE